MSENEHEIKVGLQADKLDDISQLKQDLSKIFHQNNLDIYANASDLGFFEVNKTNILLNDDIQQQLDTDMNNIFYNKSRFSNDYPLTKQILSSRTSPNIYLNASTPTNLIATPSTMLPSVNRAAPINTTEMIQKQIKYDNSNIFYNDAKNISNSTNNLMTLSLDTNNNNNNNNIIYTGQLDNICQLAEDFFDTYALYNDEPSLSQMWGLESSSKTPNKMNYNYMKLNPNNNNNNNNGNVNKNLMKRCPAYLTNEFESDYDCTQSYGGDCIIDNNDLYNLPNHYYGNHTHPSNNISEINNQHYVNSSFANHNIKSKVINHEIQINQQRNKLDQLEQLQQQHEEEEALESNKVEADLVENNSLSIGSASNLSRKLDLKKRDQDINNRLHQKNIGSIENHKIKKAPESFDNIIDEPNSDSKTRSSRGLRVLSLKVKEIVFQKKETSYKEVAESLIGEVGSRIKGTKSQSESKNEQNVKRRVYDALNVLIAADILKKRGKIVYCDDNLVNIGLNKRRKNKEENERLDHLINDIKKKNKHKIETLQELTYKCLAIKHLLKRNKENEANLIKQVEASAKKKIGNSLVKKESKIEDKTQTFLKTSSEDIIKFPFIVLFNNSSQYSMTMNMSPNKHQLNILSRNPLTIFGDIDILLKMKLHCVQKDFLEENLPKELIKYLPNSIIRDHQN